MANFSSILDVVGKTPLLRFQKYTNRNLLVKLESYCPSGCIFDRLSTWQAPFLLQKENFQPDTELLVKYDDFFAVSWGWTAIATRLKLFYEHQTSSPRMTKRMLAALDIKRWSDRTNGEQVQNCSQSTLFRVEEDSFSQLADYEKGTQWNVVREIYEELGSQLNFIVLPFVSSSFISESCAYLHKNAPQVRIILSDIKATSNVNQWKLSQSHKKHRSISSLNGLDSHELVFIDLLEAARTAWSLIRTEGLFTDLESAAAIATANQIGLIEGNNKCGVTIVCSNGLHYLGPLYTLLSQHTPELLSSTRNLSDNLLSMCIPGPGYLLKRHES